MESELVRMTPDVRQKFVLVRVASSDNEALMLWGNPNIQWHKEIVEEITNAGYHILESLGGGWLMPVTEKGTVYVWGTSDRLGTAPKNLVREALTVEIIEEEP